MVIQLLPAQGGDRRWLLKSQWSKLKLTWGKKKINCFLSRITSIIQHVEKDGPQASKRTSLAQSASFGVCASMHTSRVKHIRAWLRAIPQLLVQQLHPFQIYYLPPPCLQSLCASIFFTFLCLLFTDLICFYGLESAADSNKANDFESLFSLNSPGSSVKMSNCFLQQQHQLESTQTSKVQQWQDDKLPKYSSGTP